METSGIAWTTSAALLTLSLFFIRRYITSTDTKISKTSDSIDVMLHKMHKQYIEQKTLILDHQKEINSELQKFHALINRIKIDLAKMTSNTDDLFIKIDKALKELNAQQKRIDNLTKAGFLSKEFQERLRTEVIELSDEVRLVRDSLSKKKIGG